MLQISDLCIGYKYKKTNKIIFSKINISAKRGELIALLGANGVGKSTLMRTMAKLQTSVSGKIYIDNKDIGSFNRHEFAKSLSFVSTEPVNIGNLSVYELVSLGRYPYTNWFSNLKTRDKKIIKNALSIVGILHFSDKKINELSDGEKQKVMIARSLAQDTNIIILDEPTAFLDIANKYEIVEILNRLTKDENKIVIFSTHDLNIAIKEVDKIWLMKNKNIIEGAPEDIVLENGFSDIFDSSKIIFDNKTADFKINRKTTIKINLVGNKIEKIWTEKALERLGFRITNENVNLKLKIINKNSKNMWILSYYTFVKRFTSVYELLLELKIYKSNIS